MKHQRRGIALVTVIAAVVVVMMLLGAFLQSHQSQLALAAVGRDRQACRDAAFSLADFCRFRLEEDASWLRATATSFNQQVFRDKSGNPVFTFQELDPAQMAARPELAILGGRTLVEGTINETGVQFRISVVNNLARKGTDPVHQVAGECCRLRIQTLFGRSTETVEILLRNAAYFSSTVAASGDIELGGDTISFQSTDPLRNQIRSLSTIKLPDTPDINFRPDPSSQRAEKGTVWAYNDIEIDQNATPQKLLQAATQTGGEFIPQARTAYTVPSLSKQDIGGGALARFQAGLGPAPLELDSARYVFVEQDVEFLDTSGNLHTKNIHTVRKYQPGRISPQNDTFEEFHFSEAELADPNYTPDFASVRIANARPNDPLGTPHPLDANGKPIFTLPRGPEFYLPPVGLPIPPVVTLPAEEEIVVRGDFGIETWNALKIPTLDFFDSDPLLPDPNNPDRGHLEVERDLKVQCVVRNGGKLIADRDIQLTPKDVDIASTETEDLAVYAGNDITIIPVFTTVGGFLTDPAKKFTFRGLVYAQNDFKFLSSIRKNQTTATYERRLEVEGALIAQGGEVEVQGEETVILKYNPNFLDDLLEKNFLDTHSQLEEISWRPL